jgi:hypothetical protein
MTPVPETIIVAYENDEHRRYAKLCGGFGFDMVVNADLSVGTRFTHPKGHFVRLDRLDDTTTSAIYDPMLIIRVRSISGKLPRPEDYEAPLYPDHYSDVEWDWLQSDEPSDFEFLTRQLYLWTKIRPHRLNTQGIDNYTLFMPNRPVDEDEDDDE